MQEREAFKRAARDLPPVLATPTRVHGFADFSG
jgi:hypothetical protein